MECYGIPGIRAQSLDEFKVINACHKWGVKARGTEGAGLLHFYTDDYKFNALYNHPQQLLKAQCEQLIEVNYSTYHSFPLAFMLWQLYQKRTMSQYWQDSGRLIWVDINVDPCMSGYNFIGVPSEHAFYATRYLANYPRRGAGLNTLEADYSSVLSHCIVPHVFLVYGGGENVKEYCFKRGWLWIPERWRYEKWGEVVQHQREVLLLKQEVLTLT